MESYLVCFEIEPVQVGKTYEHLPPHCTLMHWFGYHGTAERLIDGLSPLVAGTSPVQLELGETAIFGPPDITVSRVRKTPNIKELHMAIYCYLGDENAAFTKPLFVGEGYKPHVSHREAFRPEPGTSYTSNSVFVARSDREHAALRQILAKFELRDQPGDRA